MRSRQRLSGTLESIQRRGLMRGIQFRLRPLSKIKWPKYGEIVPILEQQRGPCGSIMAGYHGEAATLPTKTQQCGRLVR